MSVLKAFVPLAVFGALAAKLVLDWAGGKRPFRGETDTFGTSDHDHDLGFCGDSDGGDGDGGHC